MEVLYSLVFIFNLNDAQYSVVSERNLTKTQCIRMNHKLMKERINNPPIHTNENGETVVWFNSQPNYVCVPTSLR